MKTSLIQSPLGTLRMSAEEHALVGLYFPEHKPAPKFVEGEASGRPAEREIIEAASRQLEEYFAGARTSFDVPLDLQGTEFQRAVWKALLAIPYGETRSYRELAEDVGRATAVRAVGTANGRNPVSILVPCHRVIGSDGSETGYAGGVEKKKWLLSLERTRRS
jgi:methylated-DNA-[protein]-cysteine S-methyltransferase